MHFSCKQTILLCIKDKELQSVISILLLLVHGLSFCLSLVQCIDGQQVSEEVERALAKLGPARLNGRSKAS
jgi:hypothetical protein